MRLRRRKCWRWAHGFTDWQYLARLGCWFHPGVLDGHDYFCRGDRMFHGSFGAERGDVVFIGSYVENWHGGIQTPNLDEALDWLHGANGSDNWHWSK